MCGLSNTCLYYVYKLNKDIRNAGVFIDKQSLLHKLAIAMAAFIGLASFAYNFYHVWSYYGGYSIFTSYFTYAAMCGHGQFPVFKGSMLFAWSFFRKTNLDKPYCIQVFAQLSRILVTSVPYSNPIVWECQSATLCNK